MEIIDNEMLTQIVGSNLVEEDLENYINELSKRYKVNTPAFKELFKSDSVYLSSDELQNMQKFGCKKGRRTRQLWHFIYEFWNDLTPDEKRILSAKFDDYSYYTKTESITLLRIGKGSWFQMRNHLEPTEHELQLIEEYTKWR